MSNWQYATVVPTKAWRSAMTVPRDLALEKVGEKYLVTSKPVKELDELNITSVNLKNINARNFDLTSKTGRVSGSARLKISSDKIETFSITLSNTSNEKVIIGYDQQGNNYYIDRTSSGNTSFEKGFAAKHTAPRLSTSQQMNMTLIMDDASVELFADNGLSVMTAIFFPDQPLSNIKIQSPGNFKIKELEYHQMKSIWGGKE